jgi:hypothetical protein
MSDKIKNSAGYIIVPRTFKKFGFDYKLVWREKDVVIYEQSKPHHTKPYFEVLKVKTHEGYEIAGNKYEKSEYLPSSEEWGKYGFTCVSLKEAKTKAGELLKCKH